MDKLKIKAFCLSAIALISANVLSINLAKASLLSLAIEECKSKDNIYYVTARTYQCICDGNNTTS